MKNKRRQRSLILILSLALPAMLSVSPGWAEGSPPEPEAPSDTVSAEAEMDQIAEAMANPLSYLWLLFMQNDITWYEGDALDAVGKEAKPQNTFLLNPVLSVQLTEKWKTIIRPVIPINSFNTVDNLDLSVGFPPDDTIGVDRERKTGLGDIVLWTAFSKQYTPPWVWGFGPTLMFNTATDEQLGTGKNSAGPMAMLFNISEKWILGAVAQHWWSFDGGDDNISVDTGTGSLSVERSALSLTDLQYVIRRRLSVKTNVGVAPNIRYNWKTDELNLPIGMGADTLIKVGPLPVKVGLEAYYYPVRDDTFGPEWQLRFLFIPVVPSPGWARTPLF